MEALKCEWCAKPSSTPEHPECRERARHIWDEVFLSAWLNPVDYKGPNESANRAIEALRGRMFR